MSSPGGLDVPPAPADPSPAGADGQDTERLSVALPAPATSAPAETDRTGVRLAAGVAATLLLTALIAKGGSSLGSSTTVEIGLVLVGAGVAGAALLRAPRPARAWGGLSLLALAGLAAWTALSVVWSVVPETSWQEANRALAYVAAFAGAIGLARLFPWRAGALLAGVLAAMTALCAIALALKAFPVALDSTEELARLRDPIDYWNALGLLAAFAIPPALWLGARREGPEALRAAGFPLLALAVVTLALSYSRGVAVAVVVGLAFWFAVVPLRLRGLVVLGVGAGAGGAVSAWAFANDTLSKDRAPLAGRVDAGEDLALLLALMVGLTFAAGIAVDRYRRRRPATARWRKRAGLAGAGAVLAPLLVAFVALAISDRGIGGHVSHAWDNFFSTTRASTTYGPERLKSIGTRRGSYWREAEEVWSSHEVLGVGAGGFAVARKRYRTDGFEVQHAHGYVPQTAADLGLIGLAISLLALVAWIAAAARTMGSRRRVRLGHLDPRRLPAAAGRAAGLLRGARARAAAWADRAAVAEPVDADRVALLTLATIVVTFGVHSLIDWTWMVPGTALVALVCAGFVAGRGPAGVPGPQRTGPIGLRAGAAAGVALIAMAGAWAIWQPLRADRASNAALATLAEGRHDDALVQAQAARDRNPLALRPLFELSAIQDAAGRKPQAQRALERAVRLQPANPESWVQLATYQLNSLNQPAVAFQSARAALFLDPKSPSVQSLFLDAYRRLPRRQVPAGGRNPTGG